MRTRANISAFVSITRSRHFKASFHLISSQHNSTRLDSTQLSSTQHYSTLVNQTQFSTHSIAWLFELASKLVLLRCLPGRSYWDLAKQNANPNWISMVILKGSLGSLFLLLLFVRANVRLCACAAAAPITTHDDASMEFLCNDDV